MSVDSTAWLGVLFTEAEGRLFDLRTKDGEDTWNAWPAPYVITIGDTHFSVERIEYAEPHYFLGCDSRPARSGPNTTIQRLNTATAAAFLVLVDPLQRACAANEGPTAGVLGLGVHPSSKPATGDV